MPTRDEHVLLAVLANAKTLMNRADLEAGTVEHGRKISQKTISKLLASLTKHELVSFPNGKNKGARITDAGKALVADGIASR